MELNLKHYLPETQGQLVSLFSDTKERTEQL